MAFELLNPEGLEKPSGYSHLARMTSGRLVFIAGQAPLNKSGAVIGKGSLVAQFRKVMDNLKLAIVAAGGKPDQYAVLTIYVTDLKSYVRNRKRIGAAYREVFGTFFPAMTLVEVKNLYPAGCMVEISGLAIVD